MNNGKEGSLLYSRSKLLETLEHFDVNRVTTMSAQSFIERYLDFDPMAIWGIRSLDKRGGGGTFHHWLYTGAARHALLREAQHIPNLFVCESMAYDDRDNLVCNGEVELYKDEFGCYSYRGFINRQQGLNCRVAGLRVGIKADNPNISIVRSRHQVPDTLIDLLWKKEIVGSVVEFSIYNRPVGIKRECLLIWEIRRY